MSQKAVVTYNSSGLDEPRMLTDRMLGSRYRSDLCIGQPVSGPGRNHGGTWSLDGTQYRDRVCQVPGIDEGREGPRQK